MNFEDFAWRNIPLGPSPEKQRQDREEKAKRWREESTATDKVASQQIARLEAKYGKDLSDYGRAYRDSHKPGNHTFVPMHMAGPVLVEEVRSKFAIALLQWLSTLPEDTKEERLTELLADLDHFF